MQIWQAKDLKYLLKRGPISNLFFILFSGGKPKIPFIPPYVRRNFIRKLLKSILFSAILILKNLHPLPPSRGNF
jgi:hypothetical protein